MDILGATVSIASIIFFAAGIILLFVEMFIPGFGIFGGLGLLSLILCIVVTANSFESALFMVFIFVVILILFALLFARSLKKGVIYKSFVHKNAEERNEGFVSNDDYSRLLGKIGKSVTILRPSGIAEFDGERVDVVTDGDFITRGSAVEVFDVAGRRVAVRLAQDIKKDKAAGLDTAGNSLDI